MKDNVKNNLIKDISDISKKIRSVEDFSKKIGISPDRDLYYVSLKSYKKALEDILRSTKE
tara:strand:+ start:130 stop:309 length:180 start_codon:yes stop_codon:yes gene_type:complete